MPEQGSLLGFLLKLQEECGGVIPFHRFMAEALHHPRFGYYAAGIRDIGARGDFSTSATLSEDLGKAIAAWVLARAGQMGWRRLPLIEVGAGNGDLAASVMRHLGWMGRLRANYRIVETSPVLRRHQQERLGTGRIRWNSSVEEALQSLDGRALIFSNELVDAFPCRVFEKMLDGWKELAVTLTPEGNLSETLLPGPLKEDEFTGFGNLSRGQRVERHESYRAWLASWSPLWREGSLLTIDYGETARELYAKRPQGSVRAYWRQERLTGRDIYGRFGRQDLTADVNFSDLIAWGNELGWNTVSLVYQREFLTTWLGRERENRGVSGFIASPDGAGEAFKVLEQRPAYNP